MPKSQDISSKFSLSEEPFASLYDVAVRPSEASHLFSDWQLMRPDEMCLQKMSQQEILLQPSFFSNINISCGALIQIKVTSLRTSRIGHFVNKHLYLNCQHITVQSLESRRKIEYTEFCCRLAFIVQIPVNLKINVSQNFLFSLGLIPRNNGDFEIFYSRHLFSLGMSGGGWVGDKIKF